MLQVNQGTIHLIHTHNFTKSFKIGLFIAHKEVKMLVFHKLLGMYLTTDSKSDICSDWCSDNSLSSTRY